MTKAKFLSELKKQLSNLPHSEIIERVNFYSEMIDDLIEEGLSEEEAVKKVGDVNEIASQIVKDVPYNYVVEEELEVEKKFNGLIIALLIIGSPIWLSLLVAGVAVLFSVYAVLLASIITAWAIVGALLACAIAGVLGNFILIFIGEALTGLALLGMGFVCAGLFILSVFVCKQITKRLFYLIKWLFLFVKRHLLNRREA